MHAERLEEGPSLAPLVAVLEAEEVVHPAERALGT